MRWSIPVTPSPDDASSWIREELSNGAYAASEPTWFDKFSRSVIDALSDALNGRGDGSLDGLLAFIAIVVVIGLVAVAVLIWGRPRLRASSSQTEAGLFEGDADKTAAELRREALQSAEAQDWTTAVVLSFRALARSLSERGVVALSPGATVHAFASGASAGFPDQRAQLERTAAIFDDVRYLRLPASESLWQEITSLDAQLQRTRPAALASLEGAL